MAYYSVATTKDKLSSLIDKALAGEEVVITRHGKPTVELRIVREDRHAFDPQTDWLEKLKAARERIPPLGISSVDLIRNMREEGEH